MAPASRSVLCASQSTNERLKALHGLAQEVLHYFNSYPPIVIAKTVLWVLG